MCQGILLVNKEAGSTSFRLVSLLRRITREKTIGHAGTLDPFATGVMVMMIGRSFTKRSEELLTNDKQYEATLTLGITTDTYDIDGQITHQNDYVPTLQELEIAIASFQGSILQVPPMFSAKKKDGKKLYDLARKGIIIEREPSKVHLSIQLLEYQYPKVKLLIDCSKGTYIRSLAYDLGQMLGCGAHLSSLTRTKSGPFQLEKCIPESFLKNPSFDVSPHLLASIPLATGNL
jgi:tRNA pseudouridine55 synthase